MAIQIIGVILIITSSFWLGYRVANRRNEADSLALIELAETLSKVFDEVIPDVDNNLDK